MARTLEKNPRFAGVFSRTKQRIAQNLGIIDASQRNAVRKFRNDKLEHYDAYYESRQYNHLLPWDSAVAVDGDYVPVRKRKPRIIYNLPKVLVDRVAAKLVGQSVFPGFTVEGDPETTEFLRLVMKLSQMRSRLMDPIKKMLRVGSSFARFYVVDGKIRIESYDSKYCYPKFKATGELESIEIKYVFDDPKDRDANGNPKKKWYKLELNEFSDILYDNPEYQSDSEPVFTVVEQVDHNLGFVQGEWFRTSDDKHSPDGYSLLCDILDLVDEINYSLSQSSQAISYNQEPQLAINNLSEEEVEALIRSSTKAWNLGREGKAQFVESSMNGNEAANTLRDRVKRKIVDVVRVVMLDPEKIVGSAQSGKAMEILHGPLIELIDELRPFIEQSLVNFLLKMAVTMLKLSKEGVETALVIPPTYAPLSFDVSVSWPPVFPLTIEDLQKKAGVASSLTGANIFSRKTMLRWLAKDFGVEDIEAEMAEIAAQPILNPFGVF